MTRWVCWMLVPAVSLGGCAAQQTLVEYQPGHPASVGCTAQDAIAGLYDDCGRIEATTVQAGEPIGFARSGNRLVAIDGAQQILLAEGHYAWRIEPPGRHCSPKSPAKTPPSSPKYQTGPVVLVIVGLGFLAAAWDAFVRNYCS